MEIINRKRLGRAASAVIVFFLLAWTALPLRLEIAALHLYQQVGSPITSLVVTCRFDPTCSHYALSALNREGFWKGNALILRRLALCSPLGLLIEAFE